VGRAFAISGLILSLLCAAPAVSQTAGPAACPPDVKGEPPIVGGPSSPNLSDRLADSRGVICPPAGHDPGIEVAPPDGGRIKVIPPPGTPERDPNVQPK
jgi:hypothetical protein